MIFSGSKLLLLQLLVSIGMVILLTKMAVQGDWQQWHGPNRDGVTPESSVWPMVGLLRRDGE